MQEGNDDINRVIYVPFTTMGDLKDTHYLDSIWFNYEVNEYRAIWSGRCGPVWPYSTSSTRPTDRRCLYLT